ncbi:DUF4142 domain-containing protein [Parapedobacter indicus]|nr:DUF4142 domain-containing protein [Parapedobacter indicus]
MVSLEDVGRSQQGMQDQEFVVLLMSSNRFEIEAGGVAYSQGINKSVVECGIQMASDHGAVCTELAALATLKGWRIPDDLQDNEQRILDELTTLNREMFDREFAKQMILWYEATIALLEQASGLNGAEDEELRLWVEKKLSVMKYGTVYQPLLAAYSLQ